MTIAAYQTLYQSSVTFAMRKQLQAEHGKADLDNRISELEDKKSEQDYKIVELKAKIEAIDKRNADRKHVDSQKREEELKYLKLQEGHLLKFVQTVKEKQN